ncbi:hypothetical protein H6P81_018437 [Aristolochia fimbriata]|uniref:Uncharacterized protein n=1 Tax=Aristolochia fimbriata TaxID=158543 RepID=A0AAV7E1D9_ARIFI|nr:hypothetical protein H6P81_018437 [Aristolochia fimbriata]
MAAPSVTLVGGLRAFDHTVVVEGETIQTLALYMEGDASHMTYLPGGESVFGGHAEKPTSLVDSSLILLHNGDLLWHLGIPLSRQGCDVSMSRAFLGALESPRRTRFSVCPSLAGFTTRFKPMVADFKEVRSTDLPFSCRYRFGRTTISRRSYGSNVISSGGLGRILVPHCRTIPFQLMTLRLLGMPVLGKIALFRESSRHERDVFHFLHVTPGREDEVHLALPIGLVVAVRVQAIGDEIRPMVLRWLVIWPPGSAFALAVLPWPAFTKFGYCQDLPGDMGITANHRRLALYRSWWPFGKPALFALVVGLICLRRENGTHLETQGTTPAYYTWWATHMSSLFQQKFGVGALLFPRWRIVTRTMTAIGLTLASGGRMARGQLVLLREQEEGSSYHFGGRSGSASKKKKARKEVLPASFPLCHRRSFPPIREAEPPTSCPSENPPIETVQILSSLRARSSTSRGGFVVGELAEITPAPRACLFKRSLLLHQLFKKRRWWSRQRLGLLQSKKKLQLQRLKFQLLRQPSK